MVMSQSVNLPSQILESLGNVTQALRQAKRELKDAERGTKQRLRETGVVSSEDKNRLDTLRSRKNHLEVLASQQKSGRRGPGSMSGDGSGFRQLTSSIGLPPAIGNVLDTGANFTKNVYEKYRTQKETNKALKTISYGTSMDRAIAAKHIISPVSASIEHGVNTIRNGLQKTGAQLTQRLATVPGMSGIASLLTPGMLAAAGAVGATLAVGAAAHKFAQFRSDQRRTAAESQAGTEDFFFKAINRAGVNNLEDYTRFRKIAEDEARAAGASIDSFFSSPLNAIKSMIGGSYQTPSGEWLPRGSRDRIKFEDKIREATYRRQKTAQRFGEAFTRAVDRDTVLNNNRAKFNVEVQSRMGTLNYIANQVYKSVVGVNNSPLGAVNRLGFSVLGYEPPDFIFSDDIQEKVVEELTSRQEALWATDAVADINKWYNGAIDLASTTAISRKDQHERELLNDSLYQDYYSRGLIWSD